jgi:hypothetical protein
MTMRLPTHSTFQQSDSWPKKRIPVTKHAVYPSDTSPCDFFTVLEIKNLLEMVWFPVN